MRILIAIEPRSYREVIGQAIQNLRPQHDVGVADPEALAREVASLDPHLVLYSHPDTLDLSHRLAWVEYRPYEEPAAKICIGERYSELHQIGLDDLLSLVDETEKALRTEHFPKNG